MLYCLSHKGSLRVQCGIPEADIAVVTVMSLSGRVMSRACGLPRWSESRLLVEEEVGGWRALQAEKVVLPDFDEDGRGPLVRSPKPQGERGHVGGGEAGLKTLLFPPHWRMPAGGHCRPGYCALNRLQVVLSAASSLLPARGYYTFVGPPTPGHALPRLCLELHSSCCL